MTTKNCIDCKLDKPLKDFYKSSTHKHGVMVYCKNCFNKRCILRWINRKIKYIQLLGGKCEKCNLELKNSHYSVFEFHHKFDKSKDYDWTKLRLKSEDKIIKELNKCSLLCANCHRLEHAEFRVLAFPDQVKSQ